MASGCGVVGSGCAPREVVAAEPLDGREVPVCSCFSDERGVLTGVFGEEGEDSVGGGEVLDAECMGEGCFEEAGAEAGVKGDGVLESWEGGGEGAGASVEVAVRGEERGGDFEGVVEAGAGHSEPDAIFDANAEEDEVDDISWEVEEGERVWSRRSRRRYALAF